MLKKLSLIFLSIIFLVIPVGQVLAISETNTPATMLTGQPGFDVYGDNFGLPSASNVYSAPGIFCDGTRLFVSDFKRSRVLIYNTIPTSSGVAADVVIGQSDFASYGANQGGSVADDTLYQPLGLYSDGTKLFVADYYNHRVLIYNTIPTTNGASADVVIGQADFTSNSANRGGSVADNTLSSPAGVYSDGTRLYIADRNNNRVLIYNTIPTTNGASADVVIGQADMTSNSANQGGSAAADTLSSPRGVYSDGTNILVTDANNHRVLVFNSIPTTNGTSTDVVIGQADKTSSSSNRGGSVAANSLNYPSGVVSDGTKVFVTDFSNNRVLIYNTIPTTDGASANFVIGQDSMTAGSANKDGVISADGIYYPWSISVTGGKIFVGEYLNPRGLIFNSVPTSDGVDADVAVGQSTFTGNDNATYGHKMIIRVNTDGTRLFVSDYNHRVLMYNTIPTSLNTVPDVVIGQDDLKGIAENGGTGSVAAKYLNAPSGAFVYNDKLYISDENNHRILIYNTVPTSHGPSADVAIGQPNLTSNSANNGGRDAGAFNYPRIYIGSDKMLVSDISNNRILIFNTVPTANGDEADVVIGQPNMTSGTSNNGGVAAKSISYPYGAFYDGEKLFVADTGNNRVLIFNELPTTDHVEADVVLGQADFTSNSANRGGSVAANTLKSPSDVYSDGTRLVVTDYGNHRVLIYNTIPTTSGVAADVVIGQSDFVSGSSNQGDSYNPTRYSLAYPKSATVGGGYLFTASRTTNSRVLMFPLGPQSTSASGPSEDVHELEVTLTLSAPSDARQIMVSEDASFTGASWQTYSGETSYAHTLSSGDGLKPVYVKFRDYANYESDTSTFNINYYQISGIALPIGFQNAPVAPSSSGDDDEDKAGSHSFQINNGDSSTDQRQVTLTFDTSSDTTRVIIYEDDDLESAPVLDIAPSLDYLLSAGEGEKTVQVKFCTQYGYCTDPISQKITLGKTTITEQPAESTPATESFKFKLVKYPHSPVVYFINSQNRAQEFANAEAFLSRGYKWQDIIEVGEGTEFSRGEKLTVPGNQSPKTWTPPAGYEYIDSLSKLPLYKSVIKDPHSQRLYGSNAKQAAKYNFTEYMYPGFISSQVRSLQELLMSIGYYAHHSTTGYFGPVTKAAVQKFQQKNGIEALGVVGPQTRKILNSL